MQPHPWTSQPMTTYTMAPAPADTHPRRWNADEMWYTDGSARDHPESGKQVIGAGVFCKSHGVEDRVDCHATHPTNTITRAELCGLAHALDRMSEGIEKDEIIATDSKACMHLLDRDLQAPIRNVECKHRVLVRHVASALI